LDLTRRFGGQYGQAGLDIAGKLAPQYLGLNLGQMQQAIKGSPLLGGLNQQALAGLQSGGVTPYLGQLRSQAQRTLAQGGLDPYLNRLTGAARANLARGGVDRLLAQETAQARQGLSLGTQMSDQELRDVTQRTLAGFAAGGNAQGNQALAQEFLNRDIYGLGRQQQRQQYASGVEAQRQAALGQAQQFGSNIGQLRQGARGQAEQFGLGTQSALQSALGQAQQYGLSTQAMNQAALQGLGGAAPPPNYAGYAQAPNLAAYGTPGASYAPMSSGIGATSGTAQGLLNFGQNLFDANQNAAATQNIAAANKSAGTTGAGIGAIGSIAGGALIAV
jgi:hypothetical protein